MKLLFINALKGLKKKKIQTLGIVFMVFLSTAIYVAMNIACDRLEDRYYSYLETQNVENYTFEVMIDYKNDIDVEKFKELKDEYFSDVTEEEKNLLMMYEMSFMSDSELPKEIQYGLEMIFRKYGADTNIKSNKLDSIKDKYNFNYEMQPSKLFTSENTEMVIMPYQKDRKINKTYLVDGKFPEKDNEITMLPAFAKHHDLEIGDKYKLDGKEYKITGFTYASDYVYPLVSISMPIFDEENNNVIFMNENTYNESNGVETKDYVFDFKNESRKYKISMGAGNSDASDPDANKPTTDMEKLLTYEEGTISVGMNTIIRISRIGALQMEFASNRLFADYFLYLLLGVAVFIIMIITKKRIDSERLQIGVLKSLGYNPFSIAVSYLTYPIIGSIIGGVLGYLLGVTLQEPLSVVYRSFYAVPLTNFTFGFKYLWFSVMVPLISLSILSYLIAIFMLRKKPLDLLKEGSNLKVNLFSRFIHNITRPLPFNNRFKYSLASRSFGKLLVVTMTSFCTGLLIVLTIIGMNLFNDMVDRSFNSIKYDYGVMMKSIDYKDYDDKSTDEFALGLDAELKAIKDKNGNKKKIKEDDVSVSFTGLDEKVKYFELLDKNEKDLEHIIKDENKILVNENMRELLEVEIGDTLVFELDGTKFEYIIGGFQESYMGYNGYVNRLSLSKKIGLEKSAYNQLVSKDKKYSNMENLTEEESANIATIMNMKNLKRNIMKQMDRFNGSIYIVIGFAAVIALIIISVIANIVVEENKKTISLMKVMGYKNKRISKIVLNIYTPFVVIAYLLSIPVMIFILKAIVKALVGDTNMAIPINLSPELALAGLAALLVAYYIAVALSKKALNKIPLAIALKRE